MSGFPQIVVGTYEEFLLGYKPKIEFDSGKKFNFFQTFASHSHQASLRCVAANKNLMASSGADEYVYLYNMNTMKMFNVIDYHDATVTCLEFTPDNSHLITANQKGDIAIFQCKDWSLVKLWKEAHKHANGVTSVSVHPSGSLLLTTGADNKLIFWNLIKGRKAYTKNFSKVSIGCFLNFAQWSPTGKYYAVCIGKQLEVYKTSTASVIYKIVVNSKISCATFCKKTLICIGTDDGQLEIHSIIEKKLLIQEHSHKARLKCMTSFCKMVKKKKIVKNNDYLVTADSKGLIKLWCIKKKSDNFRLIPKCEIDCDCRITCVTKVFPMSVKKEKLEQIDIVNEVTNNETIDDIAIENYIKSQEDKHSNESNEQEQNQNNKTCNKNSQIIEISEEISTVNNKKPRKFKNLSGKKNLKNIIQSNQNILEKSLNDTKVNKSDAKKLSL
ncbi:pak inhibitor skb15, putative [Pediculus humanus corporis]|uniref:Pak inhibitor skb15, putative n=1 Tax=Pediculus humanus subsp. corporis TaxID=121224 RepID=E0VGT4_PEDHC|nr:pak inhibitor skb15, putative [Pediculus humanus corporis]EEB12590.1 pak inhibitor skb15, putative [Pediculus humanus corporis]